MNTPILCHQRSKLNSSDILLLARVEQIASTLSISAVWYRTKHTASRHSIAVSCSLCVTNVICIIPETEEYLEKSSGYRFIWVQILNRSIKNKKQTCIIVCSPQLLPSI